MARTHYYSSKFFGEEFRKLVDNKRDFELVRTSYTKKLIAKDYKIIFNNEGDTDDRVLSLINKVRCDAKRYIEENNVNIKDTKIYFLDLFDVPKSSEIICKIDITGAYWKKAILDGIVSEETNEYMINTFEDKTVKDIKKIRLKALGSLATRKEHEFYEEGKSVHWESKEQPTKRLYMNICRNIDEVMRECRLKVDGCVFYYWDCMFVRKEFGKQVIDFFRDKMFDCKMDETKLEYDKIGNKGYFTSTKDGKMYLVSSENRHLLNSTLNP